MGHTELSKKTWTNMRGDTLDANDYGRLNGKRLAAEAKVSDEDRAAAALRDLRQEMRADVRTAMVVPHAPADELRRAARRLDRGARRARALMTRTHVEDRVCAVDYAGALARLAEEADRRYREAVKKNKTNKPAAAPADSSAVHSSAGRTTEAYCTCGHGPDTHAGPNHDGPCHQVVRQVQGFAGEGDTTLTCKCQGRRVPTVEQEVITIG